MCKTDGETGCKRHNHDTEGGCHCEAHQDKFIDAVMLLLIAKDPSHGYDLIERMKRYGFDSVDPTKVYRRLRKLESDGFLESKWVTETAGPARRAYSITKEGTDFLFTWKPLAQKTLEAYHVFIEDLNGLYAGK
jgi:PadR family transcriptional regulator, regulatory protein PadR